MRHRLLVLIAGAFCVSCSSEKPAQQTQPAPAASAPKPDDETRRFPEKDRVSVRIEEGHVLGKAKLPAGNVADYKSKGKPYQLFLVKAKTNDAAALLLFDYKSALGDAKFVPSFGGYYGNDGAEPVFVFQKGTYVAGIQGLPEKDADPIARLFAARLN